MVGEASALGASFLWALTGVLVRSQAAKVGAVALTGWLCAVASPAYVLLLLATGKQNELWRAGPYLLLAVIIAGVIGRVLGDMVWVKSLQMTGVSRSLPASVSSYPLFTLALAVLFLDEPLTLLLALGSGLVVLGVYVVAQPSVSQGVAMPGNQAPAKRGVLLAVLAGLLWAVETIIVKRGLQELHPITVGVLQLPVAAAILLTIARIGKQDARPANPTFGTLAAVAGAAFAGMVGGGLLFLNAIHLAGAGMAAVLASTSPLFAIPISVLFLKEPLGGKTVLGTVLCLSGVFFLVST